MKKFYILSLIFGVSLGLVAQTTTDAPVANDAVTAATEPAATTAPNSEEVPWIEDEPGSFPEIFLDRYDGFLLQKNNRVYVPHDSKFDYERAGQNYVYRKVKESDFWVMVNKPEQAHFVLRFITVTKGRDQSALLIEPVDYYLNHLDGENLIDLNTTVYQLGKQFTNETVSKNEKLAREWCKKLESTIQSIKDDKINENIKARFTVKAKVTEFDDQCYINPILGGDYPDPTIMREGNHYYMTHSSFDYLPGLVIWHSTDLVHWEPISFGLKTYLGSVWAPDISKYKDKYYIYFTVSLANTNGIKSNFVVTADSPYGPWSDPIDLKTPDIDPCHAVSEDGQRWLIFSDGKRIRLTDDGLAVIGEQKEKFYDGWQYPEDWITEGFALEGPKIRRIGEYYYYLNAEGGTAGPPTAHMVVMARSKSLDGPWENSPYNPIIRTYRNSDHWWNKGHGSLIDTPDGRWYCVYHAYENGYTNLGRQTLLEPLEFTTDGWFRPVITDLEGRSSDPVGKIEAPIRPMTPVSTKEQQLTQFRIGREWRFYKDYEPERISISNGALTIQAKGATPGESTPMLFVAGTQAYEIECEIQLHDQEAAAGIVLYYDSVFYMGTGIATKKRLRYRKGIEKGGKPHPEGVDRTHVWLRLRNDHNIITGEYSYDGATWARETWAMDIAGYNHNTLYQFQSVLPGLFCCGKGSATFRNFKYTILP